MFYKFLDVRCCSQPLIRPWGAGGFIETDGSWQPAFGVESISEVMMQLTRH